MVAMYVSSQTLSFNNWQPFDIHVNKHIIMYAVPFPAITATAPNTQTVGQSLTLQCEVTTVRGITSRVDIVWSSNGTELNRTDGISSNKINNSLVYTDSYTISQLNTTDDGRIVLCEIIINANLLVMAIDNIMLGVTGEYYVCTCQTENPLLLYTQFPLLQSPYHHLVPYKELWWVVLKLSIVQ